jgi:hypothetical protein
MLLALFVCAAVVVMIFGLLPSLRRRCADIPDCACDYRDMRLIDVKLFLAVHVAMTGSEMGLRG